MVRISSRSGTFSRSYSEREGFPLEMTDETFVCSLFVTESDACVAGDAGADAEAGSVQIVAESGGHRSGFHVAQRSVEKREAQRLSREEECFARDLRAGIHRWVNQTTPGGPAWNNGR